MLPSQQNSATGVSLEERAQTSCHEQSLSSQMSKNQSFAWSGRELPIALQKHGNEIVQQILIREVFAALDEVLSLDRNW